MFAIHILILLFIFYAIFFIKQSSNIIFKGYAPLISTKKKVLYKIINTLNINKNSTVFELGCGKAIFLKLLEKKHPQLRLFGVESLFIPSFLLKISLLVKKSKIKIIQRDFFNINLGEADFIYCFLNNKTMEKLGEKFKNECKKEVVIISYKFPIKKMKPIKILKEFGSKIYFYKIINI